MANSSTRRPLIDLTDSDNEAERRGIRWYKAEINRLQAQVTGLQTEVLDLKAELEHSQVDLKYTREKLKKAVGTSRTQAIWSSNDYNMSDANYLPLIGLGLGASFEKGK
jgi:predicted  nucleic acid-binding Zn-ribbon protein